MPNRQASSATCYGGLETSSGLGSKSAGPSGSRSVKKLVRSLSDRYAAVTSPLTCKKKTSCSSRNPSLKTMKTTAATSLLPLKPAFSASCKSGKQYVALASSRRIDSISCSRNEPNVRPIPSTASSKSFLRMQALACTEIGSITERTHIMKRSFRAVEHDRASKVPSLASGTVQLFNLSGTKEVNSAARQLMDMSFQRGSALPVAHGAALHRETHALSQTLSCDRTKQDWQRLEALLRFKDEEIESMRTAGLMLKELCMKQDEEIKTLKAAFPATLKEMAELREACQRQEKELAYSRDALPSMQAQVRILTDQLKLVTDDLAQMKSCKEASSEKVSSHFHEREASNSSSCSVLSAEPSPVINGFLSHLRRSRRGLNPGIPCEDEIPSSVKVSDAAVISCSSVTSTDKSCELASENTSGKHRRGFSAVLSVEHMLKQSGKRSSRRLGTTDNDIINTLRELDKRADKEQALLQERCANAVKDLRSSSSRFANLEPIKSILTCASPQFFEDPADEKEVDGSLQPCKQEKSTWNLTPT